MVAVGHMFACLVLCASLCCSCRMFSLQTTRHRALHCRMGWACTLLRACRTLRLLCVALFIDSFYLRIHSSSWPSWKFMARFPPKIWPCGALLIWTICWLDCTFPLIISSRRSLTTQRRESKPRFHGQFDVIYFPPDLYFVFCTRPLNMTKINSLNHCPLFCQIQNFEINLAKFAERLGSGCY